MTFEEDNAAMTADRKDVVVVGVDGTDRDADALVLASRLVSALRAPVVIAHAHPYGPLSGLLGDGEHERLLRELAEAIGERTSAHLRDADVTMQLLADTSPARALHRIVADRHAQMLVVGSSVRSRVGLTGPGSISERAIQGSPCPVAIAPLGYATTAPARLSAIGCAFDDDAPARAALEHAARLAEACAARLEVTAVFEPISYSPPLDAWTVNGRLRDDLQRALTGAVAPIAGLRVEAILFDGRPAERLAEWSAQVDLLVTGSRGYGPLRSILLGGVSGQLIRTAQCPVVVCPRPADTTSSRSAP